MVALPRRNRVLAVPLALGLAYAAPWPRRALVPALAATGMLALALNGIGAFASRSAVAQAVYTADGASLAMEGWRWPPARLLGLGARSR